MSGKWNVRLILRAPHLGRGRNPSQVWIWGRKGKLRSATHYLFFSHLMKTLETIDRGWVGNGIHARTRFRTFSSTESQSRLSGRDSGVIREPNGRWRVYYISTTRNLVRSIKHTSREPVNNGVLFTTKAENAKKGYKKVSEKWRCMYNINSFVPLNSIETRLRSGNEA